MHTQYMRDGVHVGECAYGQHVGLLAHLDWSMLIAQRALTYERIVS